MADKPIQTVAVLGAGELGKKTDKPLGLIAVIKGLAPEALCARLERLSKKFKKEIFHPSRLIREGAYG